MESVWAGAYIALLFLVQALNILSLPANWIVLILVGIWKFTHPALGIGWGFVTILAGFAVVGEVLEFVGQAYGAKKFGASKKGNLGGIIGAILGAILGAPILFGLGALFGALAGAFAGCLLFELLHDRTWAEAVHASWGAFYGKAFGMAVKMGLGMAMVFLSIPKIWP